MKYESQPKCIVQYNIGWKKAFDSIFVCFAQKNFLGGANFSCNLEVIFSKGAFNNYVDRILPFFDSPPPLSGQFLYPGQKQTCF